MSLNKAWRSEWFSLNKKSQKVTKMLWTFTLTRILKIVINSWSLSTYSHTSVGWVFFSKSIQTSETAGIFCRGVGVPAFVLKVKSQGGKQPRSLYKMEEEVCTIQTGGAICNEKDQIVNAQTIWINLKIMILTSGVRDKRPTLIRFRDV